MIYYKSILFFFNYSMFEKFDTELPLPSETETALSNYFTVKENLANFKEKIMKVRHKQRMEEILNLTDLELFKAICLSSPSLNKFWKDYALRKKDFLQKLENHATKKNIFYSFNDQMRMSQFLKDLPSKLEWAKENISVKEGVDRNLKTIRSTIHNSIEYTHQYFSMLELDVFSTAITVSDTFTLSLQFFNISETKLKKYLNQDTLKTKILEKIKSKVFCETKNNQIDLFLKSINTCNPQEKIRAILNIKDSSLFVSIYKLFISTNIPSFREKHKIPENSFKIELKKYPDKQKLIENLHYFELDHVETECLSKHLIAERINLFLESLRIHKPKQKIEAILNIQDPQLFISVYKIFINKNSPFSERQNIQLKSLNKNLQKHPDKQTIVNNLSCLKLNQMETESINLYLKKNQINQFLKSFNSYSSQEKIKAILNIKDPSLFISIYKLFINEDSYVLRNKYEFKEELFNKELIKHPDKQTIIKNISCLQLDQVEIECDRDNFNDQTGMEDPKKIKELVELEFKEVLNLAVSDEDLFKSFKNKFVTLELIYPEISQKSKADYLLKHGKNTVDRLLQYYKDLNKTQENLFNDLGFSYNSYYMNIINKSKINEWEKFSTNSAASIDSINNEEGINFSLIADPLPNLSISHGPDESLSNSRNHFQLGFSTDININNNLSDTFSLNEFSAQSVENGQPTEQFYDLNFSALNSNRNPCFFQSPLNNLDSLSKVFPNISSNQINNLETSPSLSTRSFTQLKRPKEKPLNTSNLLDVNVTNNLRTRNFLIFNPPVKLEIDRNGLDIPGKYKDDLEIETIEETTKKQKLF